jgi:Cu/Zn superoxide dismutase
MCRFSLSASFPFEMMTWVARADLHVDSSPMPIGTLIFTQPDFLGSTVRVTGTLFNLIPNTMYHGFHVHTFALPDGEWNCTKAGEHWNPYGTISFSSLPKMSSNA